MKYLHLKIYKSRLFYNDSLDYIEYIQLDLIENLFKM